MATKQMTKDPAVVYAAVMGAAGEGWSVRQGERVGATHPGLRQAPSLFVDGSGTDEEVAARVAAADAKLMYPDTPTGAPAVPVRSRIDPRTPLSELYVCVVGLLGSQAGSCGEGVIVTASDPRLALVPQAFRPLLERIDG